MKNFTPICQRYTDVMAHKYYLQDLLFNRTQVDTTVIIKLTLIIINLQVMANNYQNAQVCVQLYMYVLIQMTTFTYYCRWKKTVIAV